MHGGQIMYHEIREAISRFTLPPSSNHRWVWGFFKIRSTIVYLGVFRGCDLFEVDKTINCRSQGKW